MRTQPSRFNASPIPSGEHPRSARTEQWFAMLPELAMLATVAVFAVGGLGPFRVHSEVLMLALAADAATLLAFSTLIDLASRLKKALPWWLGLPVGFGILVLDREVVDMLGLAWSQGMAVFLPFAWTLLERVRQLWTLPSAAPIEKIRRRTLTFDRLYVGIVVMALLVLSIMLTVVTGLAAIEDFSGPTAVTVIGTVFYATAAFNAWRVYRPEFSRRPRSLLPRIDQGQASSLDSL